MKYKKLLVLLPLLLLSASAQPSITISGTGHPYYPIYDGASITYAINEITGTWNETTGALDVTSRTSTGTTATFTHSITQCPEKFGNAPLYEQTLVNSFQDMLAFADGKVYMGQAVNHLGWVIIPPEPMITFNPVAGETIENTNTIYESCESDTIISTTSTLKYWTVAHYATWGPFSDVWRTGLHEYNGQVYNNIFAYGIGWVHFWYGTLDNGIVSGFEYYAIDY